MPTAIAHPVLLSLFGLSCFMFYELPKKSIFDVTCDFVLFSNVVLLDGILFLMPLYNSVLL